MTLGASCTTHLSAKYEHLPRSMERSVITLCSSTGAFLIGGTKYVDNIGVINFGRICEPMGHVSRGWASGQYNRGMEQKLDRAEIQKIGPGWHEIQFLIL